MAGKEHVGLKENKLSRLKKFNSNQTISLKSAIVVRNRSVQKPKVHSQP